MTLFRAVVAGVLVGGLAGRAATAQSGPQTAEARAYQRLSAAYDALRINALDSAIAHLVAVLELTPRRTDVRKQLAYSYFRVGRNDLAQDQFDAVVAQDSLDTTAALELAYLVYESTDPWTRARAHSLFDRLRRAADPNVRAQAEQAFRNVDAPLAARLTALKAALAATPHDLYLLEQQADAALERNDTALQIETYRTLLAHAGGGDDVRISLARALRKIGQNAEAETLLRGVVSSIDPELAERARELLASWSRER